MYWLFAAIPLIFTQGGDAHGHGDDRDDRTAAAILTATGRLVNHAARRRRRREECWRTREPSRCERGRNGCVGWAKCGDSSLSWPGSRHASAKL